MVRDRNVRGPFRQLKRDGRWTLAGWGFAGLTLAVMLLGVHGLVMNYHQWRAELIDGQITTARQVVFNPAGYTPRAEDKAMAQEALRHLAFTRPLGHRQDGAVGVALREQFVPNIRASWLSAVAGDFAGAEAALERAVLVREPDGQLLDGLMQFYALRKAPGAEVEGKLTMLMDRWDGVEPVRRVLAGYYLQTGRGPMAVTLMEEGVKAKPRDIATINTAAELKAALGDLDGGVAVLRAGLEQRPASPVLKETLAALLLGQNKPEEALTWITKAAEQQSTLQRWQRAAELASALGQRDAAATAQRRAREAELELADRALARTPRKEIFDRKAQVYRDLGREAEAKRVEAERDRVLARLKARSEASRKRHAE
jgi:predicted Zn-dependent protease